MRYERGNNRKLRFQSSLTILVMVLLAHTIYSDARPQYSQENASLTRSSDRNRQNQARDSRDKQTQLSKPSNSKLTFSSRQKKKQAVSLLEGVLATADKITPVEYSILTRVEAASVLWQLDKERSVAILKVVIKTLRGLVEEEKQSQPAERTRFKESNNLRFLILRKIAAMNPELITELAVGNSYDKEAINGEWTPEARAVISVAIDHIEKNPKLAARLAEQSMPLGLVDWVGFLEYLNSRDSTEAERLAIVVIDRLRDSSITPLMLSDLARFVLNRKPPLNLREHFFQSLVTRLRQDIRSNMPATELESDLYITRNMIQAAATTSQRWQPEFESLASAFEILLKEQSKPLPDTPRKRMIDVSTVSPSEPASTQEIGDALSKAESIKDSQARDAEYQRLAARAAVNEDVSLAGLIMLKIDNEDVRRETSLVVYSPLVRKAIKDSNWSQAQKYAFEIKDPLGRTLALDMVARAMLQSGESKLHAVEVYRTAVSLLEGDRSGERVAKGLLVAAKSLLPLDAEAGFDAGRSAAWALNKLNFNAGSSEKIPDTSALAIWVPTQNLSLSVDETLELTSMIDSVFKDMASRDVDKALFVSDGLVNRGVFAFARLAIVRTLFEQSLNSRPAPARDRSKKGD